MTDAHHSMQARPDEACLALHTIDLANRGVRRSTVLHHAQWMLADRDRRADPNAVWIAVLALTYAGDIPSATEHCERLIQEPLWARSRPHRKALALLRARLALLSGDVRTALPILEALLSSSLSPAQTCLAVAWLVDALVHTGDFRRAQEVLLEHGLAGRLDADCPELAQVLVARGALHLATGRFLQSVDDYLACGHLLLSHKVVNPEVIAWRSRAAIGSVSARRSELAITLAEDELLAARMWGSPRAIGVALHAVAVAKRDGSALTTLEDAIDLLQLAGANGQLVEALYDLSALYAERKQEAESRRRLRAAREVARASGNAFWVQRIESSLARTEVPANAGKLTRQENRIAQLARAGYSNREIADQLFLTVRTVEFHLSRAYRKLGIAGRRELVKSLSAVAI